MALIPGTITGCALVHSNYDRKTWRVTADFPAYNGAADSATLTAVGAAIKAKTRNGKTHTLRFAQSCGAGYDTNLQAVFAGTCAVATDDLTFNLATAANAEITTSTACKGVDFLVTLDES